jgi:hypothetical protein
MTYHTEEVREIETESSMKSLAKFLILYNVCVCVCVCACVRLRLRVCGVGVGEGTSG